MSCTYLAHHELESVLIIVIIVKCTRCHQGKKSHTWRYMSRHDAVKSASETDLGLLKKPQPCCSHCATLTQWTLVITQQCNQKNTTHRGKGNKEESRERERGSGGRGEEQGAGEEDGEGMQRQEA